MTLTYIPALGHFGCLFLFSQFLPSDYPLETNTTQFSFGAQIKHFNSLLTVLFGKVHGPLTAKCVLDIDLGWSPQLQGCFLRSQATSTSTLIFGGFWTAQRVSFNSTCFDCLLLLWFLEVEVWWRVRLYTSHQWRSCCHNAEVVARLGRFWSWDARRAFPMIEDSSENGLCTCCKAGGERTLISLCERGFAVEIFCELSPVMLRNSAKSQLMVIPCHRRAGMSPRKQTKIVCLYTR